MDKQFLCLDSPTDFMVGKYISADELKQFINIPCKIKAGAFILCAEGQIRSTINMSESITSRLNIVTLLPNSCIQIQEISPDVLIYFIAFSFDFMCYANFIKSTMGYLPMIYRYPVIEISQSRANLITDFYELLYQHTVYPDILSNKEMIKAIFTMCSQGIVEIYCKTYPLEKQELTRPLQIYQEFLNIVLKYYTKEHNVSFYAEKLGLTFSYFSTSIKKATGETPQEILTQIIIIDAKTQLKGTDQEIKNIAMDLGFNNLSFFNKFFRRHAGMTPQEYRGKSYTYSYHLNASD